MIDRKRAIRTGLVATVLGATALGLATPAHASVSEPSFSYSEGRWTTRQAAEGDLLNFINDCKARGGQYEGSITSSRGLYQAWLRCTVG